MKCASRDIQQQQGGSQIEVIPELTPEHKKALMSIFCQRINNPLTCNAHDRDSQWVQMIFEFGFLFSKIQQTKMFVIMPNVQLQDTSGRETLLAVNQACPRDTSGPGHFRP